MQDGGTVFSVAVHTDDGALAVAPHVGSGETDRLQCGDALVDEELRGFCPERFEFIEVVDAAGRRLEQVMLELRLREGLALDALDAAGRAEVPDLRDRGLLLGDERLVLPLEGRLLADAVVRQLTP